MVSLLSNPSNKLAGRTHYIKCKYGHDDKKCETCRIKCKNCKCFLEYINFKVDLVENKCLCRNKNYQRKFDENTYKHTSFLTIKLMNLFYCCQNVLTHLNKWMTGKNLVKLYYLKEKIFTVN